MVNGLYPESEAIGSMTGNGRENARNGVPQQEDHDNQLTCDHRRGREQVSPTGATIEIREESFKVAIAHTRLWIARQLA